MQWTPETGSWRYLYFTLDVGRYEHVSWTSANGITYLMGGGDRGMDTTTLITTDGNQEPGVDPKYYIW